MLGDLKTILLRELAALRAQVERYPDDAGPWRSVPGFPNSAGTLVLHLCGNLRHFVGAVLGGTGYRRDRDAEFALRDLPRASLSAEIDTTMTEVARTLAALNPATLGREYPAEVAGKRFGARIFLLHLATHLAYHLGQVDVQRRIVTGDPSGVGSIALPPVAAGGAG
jgi:hypothetical protein